MLIAALRSAEETHGGWQVGDYLCGKHAKSRNLKM